VLGGLQAVSAGRDTGSAAGNAPEGSADGGGSDDDDDVIDAQFDRS